MNDFSFLNWLSSDILQFFFYAACIIAVKWIIDLASLAYGRRKPKWQQRILPAVRSLVNWSSFYGIVLLFLFSFSDSGWLFYPLYSQSGVDVTLFFIIIAVMLVSLANRVVKLFIKYVLAPVYDFYKVEKGLGYTLNRITYYIVMVTALAVSFTSVGIDLSALGAFLSILGIGIGFGLRNVAGNFISGLIMLFERPVEIGEVIQINDQIGRVEKVRMRSTVVSTAKEGTLIVPNQYFIEQIIKNRTGSEVMAQVTVNVVYGTDSKKAEALLESALERIKETEDGILSHSTPEVRFTDFRNRSMEFLAEIPVKNYAVKERVESALRHAIAASFTSEGIELAGRMDSLDSQQTNG